MEQVAARAVDPFREKMAGLRSRFEEARVLLDTIVVSAALRQAQELDEERLGRIAAARGWAETVPVVEELARLSPRLFGIRTQISAGVCMLEAVMEDTGSGLQLVDAALKRQAYSEAVTTLTQLESRFGELCRRPLAELAQIVQQRLEEGGFRQLDGVDLLTTALYGSLIGRSGIRADLLGMPPVGVVSTVDGRLNGAERGEPGMAARTLPFVLVPIEEGVLTQPWRLVLASRNIAARLLHDLQLDAELAALIAALGQSLTFEGGAVISAAWLDLVAEAVAVLLAGPAYVGALIERSADRAAVVASGGVAGGMLPPYVRWMLGCAVLDLMGFRDAAGALRSAVSRFYGPPEFVARVPVPNPMVAELCSRGALLMEALIAQPLRSLEGRALGQVLPVLTLERWQEAEREAEVLASPRSDRPKRAKPPPADAAGGEVSRKHGARHETGGEESRELRPGPGGMPTIVLAARIAFERVSSEGGDPAALAARLREAMHGVGESFYRSAEARRVQRELSADEVRQLMLRWGAVPPADRGAGRPAGGMVGWV